MRIPELLLIALDPRTIMMMNIIGNFLMGLSLFVISRGYLAQIRGINKWAIATLLQSAGWITVGVLRGLIPDILSIIIGNGLILLSLGLYCIILSQFNNKPFPKFRVYILLSIAISGLGYFSTIKPDVAMRISILSGTSAVFMFASAYILFSNKTYRPSSHILTGTMFFVCASLFSLRSLFSLTIDSDPNQAPFGQHPLQDISYLTFFITSVMLTFCFILMCNDRYINQRKQAEEELIKAKQLAEQLAGAKDQFLSNMSHEIRTPLNGIIGFTKVLLKDQLTVKQRQQIEVIKTSGDILLVLINDILDLAKINEGKMSLEETVFNLDDLIKDILASFQLRIEEKDLKVITKYDENIPKAIVSDPVRISQILINLINNSKKFTNNGGSITIEVKLIERTNETAFVKFIITDTGIGITKEKLETIFEPFVQDNTGNQHEGTGLGLSIVKRLVKLMNGTLSIESELNTGTTVSVTLPFRIAHKLSEEQPTETQLDLNNYSELGPLKILLAEDNTINQFLAQTILHEFGFEVDTADNGKIAIEFLNKKNYDIVLMDLKMPEMGGFEATKYIRTQMAPPKSTVPIIAITADVTQADIDKYKEAGMNDYVIKPFNQMELLNKIMSLIRENNDHEIINH